MRRVESSDSNHCRVETWEGVAVVHEGLVSKGRNREALLLVTGNNEGEEKLVEEETRVNFPSICIWTCVLVFD